MELEGMSTPDYHKGPAWARLLSPGPPSASQGGSIGRSWARHPAVPQAFVSQPSTICTGAGSLWSCGRH